MQSSVLFRLSLNLFWFFPKCTPEKWPRSCFFFYWDGSTVVNYGRKNATVPLEAKTYLSCVFKKSWMWERQFSKSCTSHGPTYGPWTFDMDLWESKEMRFFFPILHLSYAPSIKFRIHPQIFILYNSEWGFTCEKMFFSPIRILKSG